MTISVAVTGGSISTVITGGSIAASVTGASIAVVIAVAQREYQGWALNDNTASTAVSGDIAGTLTGGNTADVYSTDNEAGKPSFHLDGSSQYITIPLTEKMRADEIQNLWTKYAGNPVLSDPLEGIQFPTLVPKSGGGWYAFGVYDSEAVRWESTDLITWTNRTVVMAGGGVGAWDEFIDAVFVFEKPEGGQILFYRANNGGLRLPGKATSNDWTTFTRVDNGGVDDGLFEQFGGDYDVFCVLRVGDRYYMYSNGNPSHGHLNIFYSDDDCETFTQYGTGPIFNSGFCPFVFKRGSYYYMLLSRDIIDSGSAEGDHGIAIYRDTVPTFDPDTREFLGYAVINDKSYDARYLDLPSCPYTDIYRDTYAAEFGDTLWMTYTGALTGVFCLASTTFDELDALTPIDESDTEQWHLEARTFSFWAQFDDLTNYDVVFSIGSSVADSSPVYWMTMRGGGPWAAAFYLEGGNRISAASCTNNVPYHFAIIDGIDGTTKVYLNGVLKSTLAYDGTNSDCIYLYLGRGGSSYHDGYLWDFRIYNRALTDAEIEAIYDAG